MCGDCGATGEIPKSEAWRPGPGLLAEHRLESWSNLRHRYTASAGSVFPVAWLGTPNTVGEMGFVWQVQGHNITI